MSSAEEKAQSPSSTPRKVSCTTCFDALWFCYSPVYQMQQYYRLGSLDNCFEKWIALMDCLLLKTKMASHIREKMDALEKAKPQLWTLRTPEEAAAYWKEHYGHLDEVE